MNIYINSKLQELHSPANISQALEAINIVTAKGIAIAVNNNVIPRAEWNNYLLKQDDNMTIIKATQGG